MWHLSAKKALHFLWHRAIFNLIVSRNESGALAPLFFLDISPGKARRERRSEMKKVTQLCAELAAPFVEAAGCTLWDVEYVREAGTWYLRVFIDAPGGVNIDQCEEVSRALSDKLDEEDPIEGSYVLEVGSAGADRALKKPEHFAAYLGEQVDVKLYRPRDGRKEFTGALKRYDNGDVTLDINGAEEQFTKKEIALVRLHIEF